MARLVRAPLAHFLVLGSLLLALRSRWEVPARPRLVIGAAEVTRLRDAWRAEHGSAPGPAIEQTLVRDAVDEAILYREALAAGFDRADAVRERLVRLGGFLGEDDARGRGGLEREARRLGLERADVVIRRHLVEMMRLALDRPAPGDEPTDADLAAYLASHEADFTDPATVRLTHVYLSAQARGAALARDAAAVLGELRRTGEGPDAVAPRGDPFIRGAEVGPASRADIERVFGSDFGAAVEAAPLAAWVGPIASSYGLHLVWVRERTPERVPPLDRVRSRLVLGVLQERGAARAAERMAMLRARYDVAVEAGR